MFTHYQYLLVYKHRNTCSAILYIYICILLRYYFDCKNFLKCKFRLNKNRNWDCPKIFDYFNTSLFPNFILHYSRRFCFAVTKPFNFYRKPYKVIGRLKNWYPWRNMFFVLKLLTYPSGRICRNLPNDLQK